MSKKEIIFWGLFILLNSLLFVPKFLIDIQTSSFFPFFEDVGDYREQFKYFFRRENQDPFRISLDLMLLTWILLILRKIKFTILTQSIITCVYVGWFLYQVYHGVLNTLYKQDALFYNDYYLLLEGLSLLKAESHWWILLLILSGTLLLLFGIVKAVRAFLKSTREITFSSYSKGILLVISIISLFAIIDYRTRLDDIRLVFPSKTYWTFDNIYRSIQVYKATQNFDPIEYKSNYDFKDAELSNRPNIYLIFIESYGNVLYDNETLKAPYTQIIDEKEKLLSAVGWNAVSTLSESPIVGGRSWLAYTSFLLGTKIDRHAVFQYFVNNRQHNLPTLFKSFQRQGYTSYWLSVLEDKRGDIPYADYSQFYGIDHWIKFTDLNYTGPMYGVLAAPPDQYSLNFAHAIIKSKETEPFILFFITLNSHHPFDTPKTPASDWKLLANVGKQPNDQTLDVESKYIDAIRYQFDYLTEFIIANGTSNDLFILVGDHQPPIVANKFPGSYTPVHFISKDTSLIKNFGKYQLSPGLKIDNSNPNKYHAGFYSMIMREMFVNYGTNLQVVPSYLPEGVKLNE